jgi:hypothetical protein
LSPKKKGCKRILRKSKFRLMIIDVAALVLNEHLAVNTCSDLIKSKFRKKEIWGAGTSRLIRSRCYLYINTHQNINQTLFP